MAKHKAMDVFEQISALYLLVILLFIILTAYSSNHTLFLVFIGFLPTITTIIISLLIHEQAKHHRQLLWIVPMVIMIGFYALKDSALFSSMDVEVLIGVNFLLSLLYVIFVFAVFGTPDEEVSVEAMEEMILPSVKKDKKEELKDYINSIEDKSKALNFVIGRVYNLYHGGSKKLREAIQIPSDWYNEFALIGIAEGVIDKEKLSELITKIEMQLKNVGRSEKEVFKTSANGLKNLIRDPEGNDKIIDVLDHNDKDPVRSYYEGALEFCQRIKEEMVNMEISVVKNEYIPKDEEDAESVKTSLVDEDKKVDKKKHKDNKKPLYEEHP
ncbi:MAG: hypothetical protein PHU51_00665 [Candidatus Nanoarchaeia archaeon]|nr:hypothetical protein [Candidatus Nanoarchaeia archaeon]